MSVNAGDDASTAGVVELREDIPLKPSGQRGGAGRYFTGIRFVIGCFTVLTAAITVALATQIYYGDYELVPHGSVASDAAECSSAGTDTLKAGGGAVDAGIAAALCLAVLSPHNTGLDAGGSMMMYEYRSGRVQGPLVVDWADAVERDGGGAELPAPAVPRLVAGLAWLHAQYGKLPWRQLVEPAAKLASGFRVSASLAAASQQLGPTTPLGALHAGETLALSNLADYMHALANKTNDELAALSSSVAVRSARAARAQLGGFVLFAPLAQPAAVVLVAALRQLIGYDYAVSEPQRDEQLVFRTASSLQQALRAGGGAGTAGAAGAAGAASGALATNIAVIDKDDVYVSLVTGLSSAFGSRKMAPEGFLLDGGAVPALTPIMLTENYTCGERYVLGCADVSALAQVTVRLLAPDRDLIASVELPRFHILADSTIGIEAAHTARAFPPSALQYLSTVGTLRNITEPYVSCNVVQQQGDALSSHADSRGGGIAYRF